MKRIIVILLLISTLNSCFLAITGAPHQHSYKEVDNKDDLKLLVHCMYLNKTFEVHNVNTEDSIYISSSSFKKSNEKLSLNGNNADSIRYYNWRIGDIKYHKNLSQDVIEITKITKKGNQINYKFIADNKEK